MTQRVELDRSYVDEPPVVDEAEPDRSFVDESPAVDDVFEQPLGDSGRLAEDVAPPMEASRPEEDLEEEDAIGAPPEISIEEQGPATAGSDIEQDSVSAPLPPLAREGPDEHQVLDPDAEVGPISSRIEAPLEESAVDDLLAEDAVDPRPETIAPDTDMEDDEDSDNPAENLGSGSVGGSSHALDQASELASESQDAVDTVDAFNAEPDAGGNLAEAEVAVDAEPDTEVHLPKAEEAVDAEPLTGGHLTEAEDVEGLPISGSFDPTIEEADIVDADPAAPVAAFSPEGPNFYGGVKTVVRKVADAVDRAGQTIGNTKLQASSLMDARDNYDRSVDALSSGVRKFDIGVKALRQVTAKRHQANTHHLSEQLARGLQAGLDGFPTE